LSPGFGFSLVVGQAPKGTDMWTTEINKRGRMSL
jgi:hypothetical protein